MSTSLPLQKISEICKRSQISFVALFGSSATGKTHRESDLDLAIKMGVSNLTAKVKADIIADFLRVVPKADVVFVNDASPLLKASIASTGKMVYESSASLFNSFQLDAFREYYEYKKYFIARQELNKQKIEKL